MANAKLAQLLEGVEENADRIFNKNHYTDLLSDDLFEHFIETCQAKPLIAKLEKLAEKFLEKLYPRSDMSCRGKPKITFNLNDVKLEGFHGFNKSMGVTRAVYQEVCCIRKYRVYYQMKFLTVNFSE